MTFWNVYSLFVTYASLDRPPLSPPDALPAGAAPLEQGLLSRLQGLIREVGEALDGYQIRRAVAAVDAFIHDDLSNWYVRRRRRDFWKGTLDDEKRAAYQTLYHVLVRVCQLFAPVMPFLTEQCTGASWPACPRARPTAFISRASPSLTPPSCRPAWRRTCRRPAAC